MKCFKNSVLTAALCLSANITTADEIENCEGLVALGFYDSAVEPCVLAAEKGYPSAHYNLGYMYQQGLGVVKDNVLAHMWFTLSSANGNLKAIQSRDSLAAVMTAEQIIKALDRAEGCVEKNYTDC